MNNWGKAVPFHKYLIEKRTIPKDLWKLIFLNLTSTDDFCSVSLVCKLFENITNDLNFLKSLVTLNYGNQHDLKTEQECIKFFKLASYFTKFEQFSPWLPVSLPLSHN